MFDAIKEKIRLCLLTERKLYVLVGINYKAMKENVSVCYQSQYENVYKSMH